MEGSSACDQAITRKNLLDQGYVDDQFVQLEQLGGDDCPNFAQEVITMYFEDSDRFVQNIERCLEMEPVNFVDLDKALHQLKGSSASVGANRVRIEVNRMRELCKEKNADSCKEVLQNLKRERAELKDKMDNYFQLPRIAASSSTVTPWITRETILRMMRQMLLDQAYLNNQFMLLEQLEKDDNPNFVRNIFGLYFEDTERYVQTVEHCLDKVLLDDEDLNRALYHLKGSSVCIGANKVNIEVNRLRALCKEKDVETERCKEVLQNLKRERTKLKDKMDNYFQLVSLGTES